MARGLERIFAQARHVQRPRSRRGPMEAAVLFGNRDVVDAGLAPAHQAVPVELPLLIAIGAIPLAVRIVPLILKAHRDAIVVERPETLNQAIVMFFRPFAREKSDDGGASLENFGTIA